MSNRAKGLGLRTKGLWVLFSLSLQPLALSPAVAAGRLVVCDDVRDPLTLDPHKQFAEKNHTLLQQIYEGLVRFDSDGRIDPALAVSWERVDPLRMRFHLREGVSFHDGERFDAEAVRFTIERYLDPKTGFPAGGFLASIASATVVDPLTVDIHTRFPDGLLLNRLAGFVLVVPPGYLRTQGDSALEEKPVGTGPFVFDRWEKGKRIVLSENAHYWKPGYPKVSELEFRFLPAGDQLEALLNGAVDIVTELPGTETLRIKKSPGTRLVKKETFWTVGATFNLSRPPLSDRRVRLALNRAVNRADLIRYDVLGNGRILASLTMPGETGHDPSLAPYPFDIRKAKALLQAAGYPKGFTLRTLVRAQGERTARILAGQLRTVGIVLDIQAVASDADVIRELAAGSWDMAIAGIPDPMVHSYFAQSILLYSRSPFSLSRDPKFDALLEAMASELPEKAQEELGQRLDRYVYEEALSLFTYQRIKTYGVSRRIKFTPWVTGMPYFDSVEASAAEGKRL